MPFFYFDTMTIDVLSVVYLFIHINSNTIFFKPHSLRDLKKGLLERGVCS